MYENLMDFDAFKRFYSLASYQHFIFRKIETKSLFWHFMQFCYYFLTFEIGNRITGS